MRFLVTGGAGFVGSHLSAKLSQIADAEVMALDSLSDYYSVNLKELRVSRFLDSRGIHFRKVDLASQHEVEQIVKDFQPDHIYHLGAQAGIRLPVEKHYIYTRSNLVGFSNILNAAIRFEVPNFLYASSSSVYGDHAQIPLSEKELNLKPTSFYGATKLSNELMASSLANKFPIKMRGLRFFTVYGPWGRPDMAYFRVIESLLNGRTFELYGDGTIRRDFTFIDDVVRSCILLGSELSLRAGGYHDIVNVGGGNPQSMQEMIQELESITNQKLKIESCPSNSSDVKVTHSDIALLENLVGKQPFLRINEGLEKFMLWATKDVTSDQLSQWVNSTL